MADVPTVGVDPNVGSGVESVGKGVGAYVFTTMSDGEGVGEMVVLDSEGKGVGETVVLDSEGKGVGETVVLDSEGEGVGGIVLPAPSGVIGTPAVGGRVSTTNP